MGRIVSLEGKMHLQPKMRNGPAVKKSVNFALSFVPEQEIWVGAFRERPDIRLTGPTMEGVVKSLLALSKIDARLKDLVIE